MPENLNPEHQLEELKELRAKYEAVLADAQKSGDYSEAEKLKDELNERLTALESLFPKSELDLEPNATTMARAREIMGANMYGVSEVEKAFGLRVAENAEEGCFNGDGNPYLIPYSAAELKRAQKNGEMLIYRVGYLRTGVGEDGFSKNLTMEMIDQLIKSRKVYPKGGLLQHDDYFQDIEMHRPDWYAHYPITDGWALVGSKPLPNSTGKDYIEQTKVLRDYLNNLGALTSDVLSECSDKVLDKIRKDFNSDPRNALLDLVSLTINEDFRRQPGDALYDLAIQYANSGLKEKFVNEIFESTHDVDLFADSIIGFGNGGLITNLPPLERNVNVGVILTH